MTSQSTPLTADKRHTPGPWIAEKSEHSERCFYVSHPASEGWSCVAASWAQNEHATMANARLIAAAPELLEALREIEIICTESAGDCRKRMGTRVVNTLVTARAAIAKATGAA